VLCQDLLQLCDLESLERKRKEERVLAQKKKKNNQGRCTFKRISSTEIFKAVLRYCLSSDSFCRGPTSAIERKKGKKEANQQAATGDTSVPKWNDK